LQNADSSSDVHAVRIGTVSSRDAQAPAEVSSAPACVRFLDAWRHDLSLRDGGRLRFSGVARSHVQRDGPGSPRSSTQPTMPYVSTAKCRRRKAAMDGRTVVALVAAD